MYVTRTSDINSHEFKRNMANNFYGISIESTVNFTNRASDFSVKAPLLFKLQIR